MTEEAAMKVCPLCGARGKGDIFEPNARTWLCADGAACCDRYYSGKQEAETTNQHGVFADGSVRRFSDSIRP
jgi:hypothetical protein